MPRCRRARPPRATRTAESSGEPGQLGAALRNRDNGATARCRRRAPRRGHGRETWSLGPFPFAPADHRAALTHQRSAPRRQGLSASRRSWSNIPPGSPSRSTALAPATVARDVAQPAPGTPQGLTLGVTWVWPIGLVATVVVVGAMLTSPRARRRGAAVGPRQGKPVELVGVIVKPARARRRVDRRHPDPVARRQDRARLGVREAAHRAGTASSRPARESRDAVRAPPRRPHGDEYPRSSSSAPKRSANASSASFVSCRRRPSGRRSSSQGSSRGRRCLTELTFQVAIRNAAERSRTSTDLSVHKALNLARLPVPPQPRGTHDSSRRPAAPCGAARACGAIALASVRGGPLASEHVFPAKIDPATREEGLTWT